MSKEQTAYSEELERLVSSGFGTGGAYNRELGLLGWKSQIVVPNALALQTAWRTEKEMKYPIPYLWDYGLHFARLPIARRYLHHFGHIHGTLLKQIQEASPDVVFIQDLNLITPKLATEIKKHTSLLVGEIASPLPPKAYFENYDLIVSALPSIVSQAQSWGIASEFIPLGFEKNWAKYAISPASSREIDAVFVGSFSRHQPQTVPLLQAVAREVPGLRIYGEVSDDVLTSSGLTEYYFGPAWGEQMFKVLGKSKVVVNRHGTIAGDYAVNMRMYEATGMGAALVTEAKSNLSELFALEKEVITYSGYEDAAQQVAQLLADEKRLDAIAAAGQAKTLSEHTYANRANTLSGILETKLKQLAS